jgi:glycosyltransferase involved in cell wall biosynthesis
VGGERLTVQAIHDAHGGSSDADRGEPLRLLIVVPSAVAGGQEDVVLNLALCLPSFGVETQVISLQPGPLVDRLAAHRVPVQLIDGGRLREPGRVLATSRTLASMLSSGRFDVVLSDLPKAHLYSALPARRAGIPALWCQAGIPRPPHWIDRLASRMPADGVIAVSRDGAAAQRRLRARCPVHVIHPGLDLERFAVGADPELRARHGIAPDAPLISLVGRLQPWKGQREFLNAATLVASGHPSARFAVIGGAILGWEGDYPRELERLTESLGLRDKVIFTGHTDEVPRWMAASDIVVNASYPEPFGLVVVEAMAVGCAVIAVASGGPRDIIEDGRSGLLCRDRAPATLAGAISRLVAEPSLRSAIGAGARRRVETRFSRERMAGEFAAVLRETVALRRRRSPA